MGRPLLAPQRALSAPILSIITSHPNVSPISYVYPLICYSENQHRRVLPVGRSVHDARREIKEKTRAAGLTPAPFLKAVM